ncbi:hypothetical protein FAUST_6262 [Fusarium austroamericanum]|uniref:Nephrocystin 3-like N-terminal domain-containing protein n=1 Tax=Fusarium austroamericanum TaxID=282268 RepID=A0AAN6BZI0_FUSAU|nr:hypothetical protein FAUST_6262 [Fusarium austroamericanum]
MLYDGKISQWLGRDKLAQQIGHHAYLQSLRADSACEFLLEEPEFKSWYDAPDSQQFAFLGTTGSGKSVTMSFLIDELCERTKHKMPKPIILYHYCQDAETGEALYMFSSLIMSLLEQCEELKETFHDWYNQGLRNGNSSPLTNVDKLVDFFQTSVKDLDRPLFLVIDGFDECNMESRTAILETLHILSQTTSKTKVVLSSRPCQDILNQLNEFPKINIGSDETRDKIIAEKTVEMNLASLDPNVKQFAVERLASLAEGCSIWTKMTVADIAAQEIRSLDSMKEFLDSIPLPQELSDFYTSLFSRCTGKDPEVKHMAATALEILCAARRRLSILELAWAVALVTHPDCTTVAEVAGLVDDQRVMSLIGPFIAGVDFNDLKKRQITFVLPSAKEFVSNGLALTQSGLQNVETLSSAPSIASRLKNSIFDVCVRYLLLDEINNEPLFYEEQIAADELPQDVYLFSDNDGATTYTTDSSWEHWEEGMTRYDPADRGFGEFFIYASCHWIDHFGSITEEPLPDLASVETLCQANSTRLLNWTSQHSRPDCVLQARFEFDGSLYDPLSITSLYGSEELLLKMLETSQFDSPEFLPDTAMLAVDQVLQWGDLRRLRMLFFGRGTARYLQNLDFFRRIIDAWCFSNKSYSRDWYAAFDIIDGIPDILAREGWGNELLCLASSRGCLPVTKRLMKLARQSSDLRNELLHGTQRQSRSFRVR